MTCKGFFNVLKGVVPMPRKPKHPCKYQGCPNLVECGESYCEKHKKVAAKEYEHFHRGYKGSERYDYTWRKIRQQYINAHPLCEMCNANSRVTPAVLVHHKKPIAEGGSNDFSNLMSLCNACHNKIHNSIGRKND